MGNSMNLTTCHAVVAVFFALAVITTLARFYTRIILLRRFSLDDWALLLGFIILIVYTAIYIKVINYLFGNPLLSFQTLSNVFKWSVIMLPFYLVSSMLIKLSIALRVLKFTSSSPFLKWLVITVLVIYEADSVVMIAINFTQCLPAAFTWARGLKVAIGPNCASQTVLRQTGWLFNTLTLFFDLTLAIVPWFIIRKIWSASRRMKIMLSCLLGFGSIASLATIARMFYNYRFSNSPDVVTAGNFFIWTYLELSLATIACSATTLKPLIAKVAGLSTYSNGSEDLPPTTNYDSNHSISSSKPPRPAQPRSSALPRVLRHPLSFTQHTTNFTTTRDSSNDDYDYNQEYPYNSETKEPEVGQFYHPPSRQKAQRPFYHSDYKQDPETALPQF